MIDPRERRLHREIARAREDPAFIQRLRLTMERDRPVLNALAHQQGTLAEAEQEFLNAAVAVWREIDRLSAKPGGYKGLDESNKLRKREREAWRTYRAFLADE